MYGEKQLVRPLPALLQDKYNKVFPAVKHYRIIAFYCSLGQGPVAQKGHFFVVG